MQDLMKIDIEKFGLKKLPLQFLIAMVPIGLMALVMATMAEGLLSSVSEAVAIIVRPVYVIWEGVLICKIIIDEFKNKTILMLYTYPVDKKKLILSKALLVAGYSLLGIISTQIILGLVFGGVSIIAPAIPFALTMGELISYLVSSIMVILLELIPLAVGLMTYSTVATMVVSLVIVLAGSTSGLGFDQLLSDFGIVTTMGVIGLVSTGLAITYSLKKDTIV